MKQADLPIFWHESVTKPEVLNMAETPVPLTAPSLVGRNLFLRPASPEDIANTQHWLLTSEPQTLTPEPAAIESASAVSEAYKKAPGDVSRQMFMIVRSKDNQPVARVWYVNLNSQNRSAQVDILVDPDERRKGYGAEGLKILCRHLFEQRGLNRIYAFAANDNHAGVALLDKAGFTREGTLRQFYFYDGEYHDAIVSAVMRFEYDA
jgi:diamine N-acetyltransferase